MWAEEQERTRVARKGVLKFDSCYWLSTFLTSWLVTYWTFCYWDEIYVVQAVLKLIGSSDPAVYSFQSRWETCALPGSTTNIYIWNVKDGQFPVMLKYRQPPVAAGKEAEN